MSLHKFTGMKLNDRRSTLLLMLGGTLGLAGCGFQPLYGRQGGSQPGNTELLASIRVGRILDREGQILRNYLIDRLNPGGLTSPKAYSLSTSLTVRTQRLGVRIDETTVRARVDVDATSTLRGSEIEEQTFESRTFASYNDSDDDYAALVAERDAIDRALRVIADDMRLQLASFFDKERAKGTL